MYSKYILQKVFVIFFISTCVGAARKKNQNISQNRRRPAARHLVSTSTGQEMHGYYEQLDFNRREMGSVGRVVTHGCTGYRVSFQTQ